MKYNDIITSGADLTHINELYPRLLRERVRLFEKEIEYFLIAGAMPWDLSFSLESHAEWNKRILEDPKRGTLEYPQMWLR